MSPQLDQISKEFIKESVKSGYAVLEIGAGYGLACLEALKEGAKNFTVNDMDVRHLKILALNLKTIDSVYLERVHLISGSFPEDFNLVNNTYDAVLVARVLHFMTPTQVKATLQNIYKILKPGGKVYADDAFTLCERVSILYS
jgi:ubiquinone/menaquinone biosynthesis C-methylase UbiE